MSNLIFNDEIKNSGYKVIQIDENNFDIIKIENSKVYHVQYSPIKCTCPSFQFQGGRCKHTILIRPINTRTSNNSEKKRIKISDGLKIANKFVNKINQFCDNVFIGGSIAREKSFVGDVDIAVIPKELELFKKRLQTLGIIKAQGDKLTNLMFLNTQFNVFISDIKHWGAMVLYATGSANFNQKMRTEAKHRGMLLNQHGLWRNEKIITSEEKDIFKVLGMEYVLPINR